MIIKINATVCADVDHGDDRRNKIAGSDQGIMVLRGRGRVKGQEKQEI